MKYTPLQSRTQLKAKTILKSGSGLKRSPMKKSKDTPRKELDDIVSKVIRLGAADYDGMVQCITCPNVHHWKDMDCGHFQKRDNTSTRYDLKNLAPQCKVCNQNNEGEMEKFAEYIDRIYGKGTAESLEKQAREISKNYPYAQEITRWTNLYNKLTEGTKEINYDW